MIDLAAITAALTATGTATSVLNGALDLADRILKRGDAGDPALQKDLLAVYRALIQANRDIATTEANLHEVRALLREFDRFDGEAARFALFNGPAGGVVWALRERRDGEPMHTSCFNCYEDRVISRLQPYGAGHICPRCKSIFRTFKSTLASDVMTGHGRGGW